jgi:hypothetical protein
VNVIANRRETLAKMLLALIVSAVMLAGIAAGTADAKELEAHHGGQGGEVELEFELPG